ncbi:hypothetical protein VE04_06003 [Pseudogymnoascus sp. 24MN13]|nr:hypothetical protein VE04_06003 [Pseudogymnoascus sp. 24MN13]
MEKASSRTEISSQVSNIKNSDVDITIFVDPVIEKRALAKFDKFLLPQIAILVMIAYLDRSNIGNAKVFGFEAGAGLSGNQFNIVSTVFYPTYIVFDVFWVVATKRFGADKTLAVALTGWGVTTLGTGFIQRYAQAVAVRLLLGIFEAGLLPSLIFVISTIWSQEHQAKRVAILYIATTVSGAFGGLIAHGIQSMGARLGLSAWRWLFIIEGIVSIVICTASWASMPKNAEEAWFLTAEEKEVMRARKQRDFMYKGSDTFSWSYVTMAVTDPLVYLAGITLFANSICLLGFGTFLPTIIKGLGYTSIQANYLTIPVYAVATIAVGVLSFLSDRLNTRVILLAVVPIPVIIGYAIVIGTANIAAGYFAMFLVASGIYVFNCLVLTWISINLAPDYKRSVSIPIFVSVANVSGVLSSNIYPATDAPRYIIGNSISLACECIALLGVGAIYLVLRSRNMKKEKLIADGATENGKEGDRGLHFKYLL